MSTLFFMKLSKLTLKFLRNNERLKMPIHVRGRRGKLRTELSRRRLTLPDSTVTKMLWKSMKYKLMEKGRMPRGKRKYV